MNSKKACLNLVKIEKKYYNRIFVNNKNMWPILRLIIWQNFTSPKITFKKNKKKISLIIFLNKILNNLLSLFNFFLFKKKIINKKNIFFSRKIYLQKSTRDNKYYDRLFDFVLQNRIISKNSQKVYLNEYYLKKNLAFKAQSINTFFNSFLNPKVHISNDVKDNIFKISNDYKLDRFKIFDEFNYATKNFFNWYNFGLKLFDDKKSLKRLYFGCWYSPDAMGLIAAAKKNISTFDMQHGFQGKYQGMYTNFVSIGKSFSYELLPNFFYCWNKITKSNILTSSTNRKHNIPIVGGYNWIDFYIKKVAKSESIKTKKKIFLFTMQPRTSKNNKIIPSFIKKYLNSSYFKNNLFIFRSHPNDIETKNLLYEFVNNHKKKDQIEIDNGEYNILDSLNRCTHHLTAFSSSAIEANYLKKNSAVFGEDSKLIFGNYIKKNSIIWLDGKYSNFIKWANKKNTKIRFLQMRDIYGKPNFRKYFY